MEKLNKKNVNGLYNSIEAVIKQVLDEVRWNRKEAARRLEISYKALLYKIQDCGL